MQWELWMTYSSSNGGTVTRPTETGPGGAAIKIVETEDGESIGRNPGVWGLFVPERSWTPL